MAKRVYNLPEYIYSNRPGQYQVMATVDKDRVLLCNTTDLQKAKTVANRVQQIMLARQTKIDRANAAALKQLNTTKQLVKKDK